MDIIVIIVVARMEMVILIEMVGGFNLFLSLWYHHLPLFIISHHNNITRNISNSNNIIRRCNRGVVMLEDMIIMDDIIQISNGGVGKTTNYIRLPPWGSFILENFHNEVY